MPVVCLADGDCPTGDIYTPPGPLLQHPATSPDYIIPHAQPTRENATATHSSLPFHYIGFAPFRAGVARGLVAFTGVVNCSFALPLALARMADSCKFPYVLIAMATAIYMYAWIYMYISCT